MKNLLLYIVCFFALLACKKSERLQDEYTIVSGIVSEVQRGVPIEGATVGLQELLEEEMTDDCEGSCLKIIATTTTDVNGYYQIKFKAKKGKNWIYNTYCRKTNYVANATSNTSSPNLTKATNNTANLRLIATGGLNIYFINNSQNKKLFVQKVTIDNDYYYASGAAFISRGVEKIDISTEDFLLKIKNIEAQKLVTFIAYITDYSIFPNQRKTYFIESNSYKNDTIFF